MLPHLSAAYTLARYLTRNDYEADDVVQDAFLRAIKYFGGFRGEGSGASRGWLLAIVRNTAYTWRRRQRADMSVVEFDEWLHSEVITEKHPESVFSRSAARATLAETLEQLPPEFREVIVLRELEGLSYKEISTVAGVPVGTIMSRLSRARKRLSEVLTASDQEP